MSDMAPPPVQPAPPAPPAPPMPPVAPPVGGRPGPASDTSRIIAALSLVIWPVAIFGLVADPYKNEKFIKFHAVQGLAIGVALMVLSWVVSTLFSMLFWTMLFVATMLSSALYLVDLAIGIYLIIMAVKIYNGSYVEIPVVFGLVKQYIGE